MLSKKTDLMDGLTNNREEAYKRMVSLEKKLMKIPAHAKAFQEAWTDAVE